MPEFAPSQLQIYFWEALAIILIFDRLLDMCRTAINVLGDSVGTVLIGRSEGESSAVAFLRYAPGASVPYHRHLGLETIIVLEGEQCDERGCYPAGAVMLNPEGSAHSVWSNTGCVVLIQWDKAVEFVDRE